MKIVIIGQFGIEAFGLHIKENLEAMGHNVISTIPFAEDESEMMYHIHKLFKIQTYIKRSLLFASPKLRKCVLKHIFSKINSRKCDLIICTYDYFLKDEISEIREKTGAKVVMWFPDHPGRLDRETVINAEYDAIFYKEPYLVRQFNNIYGLNVFYLPEAFSVLRHIPTRELSQEKIKEYRCDIASIGSLHSARVPILEKLVKYNLKIYGSKGPWWLRTNNLVQYHTGKFLAYNDKADAIKYAKISLNTVQPTEFEGVNVRTFEYAGAGGFQLMQYKKALPDLFEIDKEVVTYKTADEMIEKIEYYLQHKAERIKIAQAGKERAWKDHDYQKRLTRLINMTFKGNITKEDRYDYHILK